MRKVTLTAVVAALLLAACGSSGDGKADTTTAPAGTSTTAASAATAAAPTAGPATSAPAATSAPTTQPAAPAMSVPADPRAPGVTADAIKVGAVFVDLAKIKDTIKVDHGDYVAAYKAVVDKINADGGLAGRKIDLVITGVDPTNGDAAEAACTKMTRDEKVFITVGFFLGDNVTCFMDTNGTAVFGGEMNAERLAKAKAPWYSVEASTDTGTDTIKAFAKQGQLDGKVAVVGDAKNKSNMTDFVLPLLKSLNITPVDSALIDAPDGDNQAAIDAAATIAEKFKSDGAERVLVVGNASVAWLSGLQTTSFRPTNLFSDQSAVLAWILQKDNDLSVMKGALAGGGIDVGDTWDRLGGPTKECVDLMTAAGLQIKHHSDVPKGEPEQLVSSRTACQNFFLLRAALTKVGGQPLNYGTFNAAMANLGDIVLPFEEAPRHYGLPPSADGDPKVYLSQWDSTTKAFVQQA